MVKSSPKQLSPEKYARLRAEAKAIHLRLWLGFLVGVINSVIVSTIKFCLTLTYLVNTNLFAGQSLDTLVQVQSYFQRHHRHIHYQRFHQQQLPLGSGMVESACKWLIQQRFKGVGMRWSQSGFNHLLLLRLAWVNQRFDSLFPHSPTAVQTRSPIP